MPISCVRFILLVKSFSLNKISIIALMVNKNDVFEEQRTFENRHNVLAAKTTYYFLLARHTSQCWSCTTSQSAKSSRFLANTNNFRTSLKKLAQPTARAPRRVRPIIPQDGLYNRMANDWRKNEHECVPMVTACLASQRVGSQNGTGKRER